MKVSGADPRSIRTQRLLRDALKQLVAKKSFSSLTIQDVTRQARLNRTTFYLHYAGLHELLEDCARTLFEEMRNDIYANELWSSRTDLSSYIPFIESVFRHLEQHEPFYRIMLGRQGDPIFRALFQELLSELILEPIAKQTYVQHLSPKLEMTMRFFSAGFTGIASWWLEKGKPISIQQASLQIARDILPDYLRLAETGENHL